MYKKFGYNLFEVNKTKSFGQYSLCRSVGKAKKLMLGILNEYENVRNKV